MQSEKPSITRMRRLATYLTTCWRKNKPLSLRRGSWGMDQTTPGLEGLLEDVVAWEKQQYLHATHRSRLIHMDREFEELTVALAGWEHAEKIGIEPNSPPHADPLGLHDALEEEIADVLILLATLAHGVQVDLTKAVQAKFAVLQTRQYGKPDAQGVVEHIRE